MAAKNAVEQFVDAQMDVAVELSTEKEELYGRIAANRSILRNLVTTGQVTTPSRRVRTATKPTPPTSPKRTRERLTQ